MLTSASVTLVMLGLAALAWGATWHDACLVALGAAAGAKTIFFIQLARFSRRERRTTKARHRQEER